jgi:uncharacterized membrane protein YphA (DoxX/SURF4 family)
MTMASTRITNWARRVPAFAAAAILLQTLWFKFTGAAESVHIFTTLGVEPWGRIGSGIAELIAAVLLLIPRVSWMGAALALGIMGGAVLSHLTVLGIEILGDGGTLFLLALIVAACSALVLWLQRASVKPLLLHLTNRAR